MEQLLDFLSKAGYVIYPLILLSIFSWFIIIERAFSLRTSKFIPKNINDIKNLIHRGDIDGAMKLASLSHDPFSRALHTVLQEYEKGRRNKIHLSQIAESELVSVVPLVEKNLLLLSASASIAPLLGLFGTITGLIKVFSAFAISEAEEGVTLLASGISEALTAAAAGLIVAIPALFAYWIFRAVGDRILTKIENSFKEILEILE